MPDFDGGHYFLTALLPVKLGVARQPDGVFTSHTHTLRDVLAYLPPALQSPANERRGVNSPFSRCRRTHFARLVVITDVSFNGRVGRDSLVDAVRKTDLLVAQPVDQLPSPYLLFVADFDAAGRADIDGYLRELWTTMEPEWRLVLAHCHGFSEIHNGESFAHGIRRCQVETTMPFNDYWRIAPDLKALEISKRRVVGPLAAVLLLLVLGVVLAAITGAQKAVYGWIAVAGLAGIVAAGFYAYRQVRDHAQMPLPSAPDNDLPSVLKALYLQQHFVRFAIDNQGATPAALHTAFGAFIDAHRPDDLAAPSQPPGVVRSIVPAIIPAVVPVVVLA